MYDVKPVTSPKSTDCGATCLKMLLDYYDIDVPLDELIRECNTRLIGCTGKDLLRVGRAHGLSMTAWQMSAGEVLTQDRPAIVWWKYNHWCVCCGKDDAGNVIICNPDLGRFRITAETFAAFYSGVALYNGTPTELTDDFFGEHTEENDYFDT